MHDVDTLMNATLKKFTEMDNSYHVYNIELMQQRERIENLKKKLQSYHKNIEEQESIFNHFIKYTDGFLHNIINFLSNINYSKNLNLLSNCAKACLIDNEDEIKLINHYSKMSTLNSHKKKKKKNTKLVNNKSKQNNLNKNNPYFEENKNITKSKKKKTKYKDQSKRKFLQQNENIYNINCPYDTVEAKELYNIYRVQAESYRGYNN